MMENNKNEMEEMKITPERAELILVLKEMEEDGELLGFIENIHEGYNETLMNIQPLVNGRDMKRMVGTVIALRQVADTIANDCKLLGIPLFDEMCYFFGEYFGFTKTSYAVAPKEDDNE